VRQPERSTCRTLQRRTFASAAKQGRATAPPGEPLALLLAWFRQIWRSSRPAQVDSRLVASLRVKRRTVRAPLHYGHDWAVNWSNAGNFDSALCFRAIDAEFTHCIVEAASRTPSF
jgi:hypothetical protein